MKINWVSLCLLLLFSTQICGNERIAIYNAYIRNDMPGWKMVIDKMQQQQNKNNVLLLTLVNYQYGYIGWCIGKDSEKEAKAYISLARENLTVLEKNNFNPSMVHAYYAALYGYEIGLSAMRAPFIGPKSRKCAEIALKLNPENPFAYLQMGNIQYYMPALFGGSVSEALTCFLRSKELMEKNREAIRQDWNYLHLLLLIAGAYASAGDYHSAKAYYEMILRIEPDFRWIKDELYQQVMNNFRN